MQNDYPGTFATADRWYQLIGPFQSPSTTESLCTTVLIDPGTCKDGAQNVLIHATAFTEFDPLNEDQNYLGDVGSPSAFVSFQFFTPPNGQFFVVGQQISDIDSGSQINGEGCTFSATVDFGVGAC
jgi:hypothetical protein